jgi:hypothetical protein
MGVGLAGNNPCFSFNTIGDTMENAIANALRKDLFEGEWDENLTQTYGSLNVLTDVEKNNLIVELMFNKIKGDV